MPAVQFRQHTSTTSSSGQLPAMAVVMRPKRPDKHLANVTSGGSRPMSVATSAGGLHARSTARHSTPNLHALLQRLNPFASNSTAGSTSSASSSTSAAGIPSTGNALGKSSSSSVVVAADDVVYIAGTTTSSSDQQQQQQHHHLRLQNKQQPLRVVAQQQHRRGQPPQPKCAPAPPPLPAFLASSSAIHHHHQQQQQHYSKIRPHFIPPSSAIALSSVHNGEVSDLAALRELYGRLGADEDDPDGAGDQQFSPSPPVQPLPKPVVSESCSASTASTNPTSGAAAAASLASQHDHTNNNNLYDMADRPFVLEKPEPPAAGSSAISPSSRSPTDSGYRSTPRYEHDYEGLDAVAQKATARSNDTPMRRSASSTVVNMNGAVGEDRPLGGKSVLVASGSAVSSAGSSSNNNNNNNNRQRPVSAASSSSAAAGKKADKLPKAPKNVWPIVERDVSAFASAKNLTVSSVQVKRLSEALHCILTSLCCQLDRLASSALKCERRLAETAIKVVLPSNLASESLAAGARALSALKASHRLSSWMERSHLLLDPAPIYRFLASTAVRKTVDEEVAVLLTAVLEHVLDKMLELSIGSAKIQADSVLAQLTANDPIDASCGSNSSAPFSLSMSQLGDSVAAERTKLTDRLGRGFLKTSRMGRPALRALYYFLTGSARSPRPPAISAWTRISFAFADHQRRAAEVEVDDVLQAAYSLGVIADLPPPQFVFSRRSLNCIDDNIERDLALAILASGKEGSVERALSLLSSDRLDSLNQYGLCALAEAVLDGNEDSLRLLLQAGASPRRAVPMDVSWGDFGGWTPLHWALASRRRAMALQLLDTGADFVEVDDGSNTCLELCIAAGDSEVCGELMARGADLLGTPSRPSPLALAVLYDRRHIFDNLLSSVTQLCSDTVGDDNRALDSLREALLFSVELQRPQYAVLLNSSGLSFTLLSWLSALQSAYEQRHIELLRPLLEAFNSRMADDIGVHNALAVIRTLFAVLHLTASNPATASGGGSGGAQDNNDSRRRRESDPAAGAAALLQRMWTTWADEKMLTPPSALAAGAEGGGGHASCSSSPSSSSGSSSTGSSHVNSPLVQARYVNNPELADIRFKIQGRIFHAHRIVLASCSSAPLRAMLSQPSGIVQLDGVEGDAFLALLTFIYTSTLPSALRVQLELLGVAAAFEMSELERQLVNRVASELSVDTVAAVFSRASALPNQPLAEACSSYVLSRLLRLVEQRRVAALLHKKELVQHLERRLLEAFRSLHSAA